MGGIFEIESDDIKLLDERIFVHCLNKILRGEAQRTGLAHQKAYFSMRIHVADEGIDAKIENNDKDSAWISKGNSIWQFRTGDITESKLVKEIDDHPKVVAYVKSGYTYYFCSNQDYIAEKQTDLKNAMRKHFMKLGVADPKVVLYTAVPIAEWASEIPALLYLNYFHKKIQGNLLTWSEWEQLPRFSQPFKADVSRKKILQELRAYFNSDSGIHCYRIEGYPGVGKTRLALECFRPLNSNDSHEDGAQDLVLYASSMDEIPLGLFPWMKRKSQTTLNLVVDECDHTEYESLRKYAALCDGRLKILAVGQVNPLSKSTSSGVYYLKPLDNAAMLEFLRDIYKGLLPEAVPFVMRFASGYVKLATVLAEALIANPAIMTIAELSKQPEVGEVLNKFIVKDPTERMIMQGIALFTSLGWEQEFEIEGKIVMDFIKIPWRTAQSIAQKYINEGLLIKKGRYRYVTPYMFATVLAQQAWEAYGDDIVKAVFPALPNWRVRSAFLQRLSDLADNPRAQFISEQFLREDLYPDLTSISTEEKASIFQILGENSPVNGIKALQRIISHLPRDQLLKFRAGRRHIVNLLCKLAWRPETFVEASKLLLKLAEAENEQLGNNATNEWIGLFKTYLGGTAVPAIERHKIIGEALQHDSEKIRCIAVQAIKVALSVGHEYRFSGAEYQGGRIAPKEYHPKTIKEDRSVRLSAIALLNKALGDKNEQVAAEAERSLLQVARGLITLGIADEVIESIKNIKIKQENKREIRETLEAIIKWEGKHLSQLQIDSLKLLIDNLQGDSLVDRLHRWVGQWTLFDYELPDDQKEQEVENLVVELLKNETVLESGLDWLASDEAVHAYIFGRHLGMKDNDHEWFSRLVGKANERSGRVLLAYYLYGHTLAGRNKWRDEVLDSWIKEGEVRALVIFDTIRYSTPSKEDVKRLITLIREKYLPPGNLFALAWGGIVRDFAGDQFKELLQALLDVGVSEDSTRSVIQLLSQRLYVKPDEKDLLKPIALQLFKRINEIKNLDSMLENDLVVISKNYVKENFLQVAQMTLTVVENVHGVFISSDRLIQLLGDATKKAPAEIWDLVSKKLMSYEDIGLHLQEVLKGWYALVIGDEILLDWAAKNKIEGPYIVARITPIHGNPLNNLARELIINYGDNKDVASALYVNFLEGSFSGSMVEHSKSQLFKAKEWLNDKNPVVCKWAKGLVDILKREIEREQQYEEERFM